jgi:putative Mg2+ transporter-C (MgtC) family protein
VIGLERQWRQRMAGLRTNVLVSVGAASFTGVSLLVPDDASPTRVAAQVVSGIGFLGAGVIMREGLNVRGLNTAATLWCSAAVGVAAGCGSYVPATLTAVAIVLANLVLRPIVGMVNRQPMRVTELELHYRVAVRCPFAQEANVRALLLQGVAASNLRLRSLDSSNVSEDQVEVKAELTSPKPIDKDLEEIVGRLSLEPDVTAASWSVDARGD